MWVWVIVGKTWADGDEVVTPMFWRYQHFSRMWMTHKLYHVCELLHHHLAGLLAVVAGITCIGGWMHL
jgi:hypothetical protein